MAGSRFRTRTRKDRGRRELWLIGVHVPPYEQAVGFGSHDPDRRRKLLVHRGQIDELTGETQTQPLTLVPLSIYFDREGRAKVELALAKGRRLYDKRHAIADREADREAARDISTRSVESSRPMTTHSAGPAHKTKL